MNKGEYYGRLAIEKTERLEREIGRIRSGAETDVRGYATQTTSETLSSSSADGSIVKKIRWTVLRKTGAQIKIVFASAAGSAVKIKITLNGEVKIDEPLRGETATLHVSGTLPEGGNEVEVTATSDVPFDATLSATFYGYYEIYPVKSRLSRVGNDCVGLLTDGTFGVYDLTGFKKTFEFYGAECASAAKLANGDYCLAAATARRGAEIYLLDSAGKPKRTFSLGKGYTSFAVRANGGGAIAYGAKKFRLCETTVTESGVTENSTAIRCAEVSYGESDTVKALGVVNPYGYAYAYEVE